MKTKQNTTKKFAAAPVRSQLGRGRAEHSEAVRKISPRPAWEGDEVAASHLSETAEQAATRAEGNAPIAASEIEKYLAGGDLGKGTRVAPRKGDDVTDELKRQAAVEEHAAARGGKLVRGPI